MFQPSELQGPDRKNPRHGSEPHLLIATPLISVFVLYRSLDHNKGEPGLILIEFFFLFFFLAVSSVQSEKRSGCPEKIKLGNCAFAAVWIALSRNQRNKSAINLGKTSFLRYTVALHLENCVLARSGRYGTSLDEIGKKTFLLPHEGRCRFVISGN